MENIINNAPDIDVNQVTESGQQIINGANDAVKNISEYFGVDTIIIWVIALVAIILVWRIFRKLSKVILALIIIGIIIAATAGTFFI